MQENSCASAAIAAAAAAAAKAAQVARHFILLPLLGGEARHPPACTPGDREGSAGEQAQKKNYFFLKNRTGGPGIGPATLQGQVGSERDERSLICASR